MKLTKKKLKTIIKEELLKEVGEGTLDPFDWNEVYVDIGKMDLPPFVSALYEFKTDQNTYRVKIETYQQNLPGPNSKFLEVSFKRPSGSYDELTGENKALRIITTTTEIVKSFHNEHKNMMENFFNGYIMAPSGKGDELGKVSQRGKIYRRFIEKQFSNWSVNYDPTEDTFKIIPK